MNAGAPYPPYAMIVEWDLRDSIFVVTIPEFSLCHTHGHDYEEALRQGREAIATCVELNWDLGLPLPAPKGFDRQSSNRWWDDIVESASISANTIAEPYPQYSMVLEWDPRSNIFIATVPELPGARTHGATYEQAARMAREVIEMFVDAAREDGGPLPPVRIFQPRRVEAVA
jgi:predicted RNase H-like HicB family nuclease